MKFTGKEDIDAPIDDVFRMLSDFDAMERAAMRRGVEVKREGDASAPAPGLCWHIAFSFRGKPRKADVTLKDFDVPNALRFDSDSGGVAADGSIELVALSRTRTRMTVAVDLSAQSLSARLLLQSLKLAKSNLSRRFKVRVADFAKGIEDRYNRGA